MPRLLLLSLPLLSFVSLFLVTHFVTIDGRIGFVEVNITALDRF